MKKIIANTIVVTSTLFVTLATFFGVAVVLTAVENFFPMGVCAMCAYVVLLFTVGIDILTFVEINWMALVTRVPFIASSSSFGCLSFIAPFSVIRLVSSITKNE